MRQDDLFDHDEEPKPTAPYQSHSDTSRAAAEAIAPRLNVLQTKVLGYLWGCEFGSTDEGGIEALRMSPSTYRPRRIELWKLNLVRDSGRTRKLRSGRLGTVWEAVRQ